MTWAPGAPLPSLHLIFPSVHGAIDHLSPLMHHEGGKRVQANLSWLVNDPVQLGKLRHRAKLGLGLDQATVNETSRGTQGLQAVPQIKQN